MITSNQIILASASPGRKALMNQAKIKIDHIFATNIDETPLNKEKPEHLALRLAQSKAFFAAKNFEDGYIIGADTVVFCNKKILDKTSCDNEVKHHLEILNGRKAHVYTAVSVCKKSNGALIKQASKLVKSSIKIKKLNIHEKNLYIASGQGVGVGGGISIEGIAALFFKEIQGNYSSIIGLPLYETRSLLIGLGWKENYQI